MSNEKLQEIKTNIPQRLPENRGDRLAAGLITTWLAITTHGAYELYIGDENNDSNQVNQGFNEVMIASIFGAGGLLTHTILEADKKAKEEEEALQQLKSLLDKDRLATLRKRIDEEILDDVRSTLDTLK